MEKSTLCSLFLILYGKRNCNKMSSFRAGKTILCKTFLIVLVSIVPSYVSCLKSFEREITENISWVQEDLFDDPLLTFEVEFKVSFPVESCCPILDISSYIRWEHTNRQCFHEGVGSELIWFRSIYKLKPSHEELESSRVTCKKGNDTYTCIVNCRSLYFEPKMVRYAIGYECSELPKSFMGMQYVFNFRKFSNTTTCEPIEVSLLSIPCDDYYLWTSLPNLLGHLTQEMAAKTLDIVTIIVGSLKDKDEEPCFKHVIPFLCGIFFPPCGTWDSDRSRISPVAEGTAGNASSVRVNGLLAPCKEMCEEFVQGCSMYLAPVITIVDCAYFPSYNESDSCIWDKVTCPKPPSVEKARTVEYTKAENYTVGSTVEYQCLDEYAVKGSTTLVCKLSGYWSQEPECIKNTISTTLLTIISVSSCAVVISIAAVVLCSCIRRRKRRGYSEDKTVYTKRNRSHDCFVSYFSDGFNSDRLFVRKVLHPKLEVEASPPFKLLFHERDFRADKLIYANILDAIDNSNCAIVIMSQDYINSAWCREEFEEFMEEKKKDPAFGLFVIMMQEYKTLKKCSIYMSKYFRSKTYLEKNDPDLWAKLEAGLRELQGSSNISEHAL